VRAALSLNGQLLRKRPLRLTRVSVQQQQKLQVQRAAAAGSPSSTKSPKGGQQDKQRGQQKDGGKGGELHRIAGGVQKGRGGGAASADPALWQGTQTKGKAKGVRGSKAMAGQGTTGKQSGMCEHNAFLIQVLSCLPCIKHVK